MIFNQDTLTDHQFTYWYFLFVRQKAEFSLFQLDFKSFNVNWTIFQIDFGFQF